MTQLKKNTFRFSDETGNWCDVSITLSREVNYGTAGRTYYSTYYTYAYSSLHPDAFQCNPLFYLNADCERERRTCTMETAMKKSLRPWEHVGSLIYQNALSDTLVKYLMMDFKLLEDLCGDDSPQTYKSGIMESYYALSILHPSSLEE